MVESFLPSMLCILIMGLNFLDFFGEEEGTISVLSTVVGDSVLGLPGDIV